MVIPMQALLIDLREAFNMVDHLNGYWYMYFSLTLEQLSTWWITSMAADARTAHRLWSSFRFGGSLYRQLMHVLLIDYIISYINRFHNTLDRIVTSSNRLGHTSAVLAKLHWLPIQEKVPFTISTLVYNIRETYRPSYLDAVHISPVRVGIDQWYISSIIFDIDQWYITS